MCLGRQPVALRVKRSRSTATLIRLRSTGTPCRIVGRGSLRIDIAAVCGSTSTRARTTMQSQGPVPRSKGPALAGTVIESPNGAPAYGPVRNTWPPDSVNGSLPTPTSALRRPIRLAPPHVPCGAAGSGHWATEETSPSRPVGRSIRRPESVPSPSARDIFVRTGAVAPATLAVVPAVNCGAKGVDAAQGPPFGPVSSWELLLDSETSGPDHVVSWVTVG